MLLYSDAEPVAVADLTSWLGLAEARYLKRDVLRPASKKMLLHVDETTGLVHLSPIGRRHVEMSLARPLVEAA